MSQPNELPVAPIPAKRDQFLTVGPFEDFIKNSDPMFESFRGNGEGKDRTWRRGFRLRTYNNILFQVRDGAMIERVENLETGCSYGYVFVNGVDVHIHGNLEVETTEQEFRTNVEVYLLVWEPEGARERGGSRSGGTAFANYAICVNLHTPTDASPPVGRLAIYNTSSTEYQQSDAAESRGDYCHIVDIAFGEFAHRSRDQKRDQHIEVIPLNQMEHAPIDPRISRDGGVSIGQGALADSLSKVRIQVDPTTH